MFVNARLAGSVNISASLPKIGILLGKRVSALAMSLAAVPNATTHVFLARHRLKMIRIDAASHATEMI
jgi:hypothetical protein